MPLKYLCTVEDVFYFSKKNWSFILPDKRLPLPGNFQRFKASVVIHTPDGNQMTNNIMFTSGFYDPDIIIVVPDIEKDSIPRGSQLWVDDSTYNRTQAG